MVRLSDCMPAYAHASGMQYLCCTQDPEHPLDRPCLQRVGFASLHSTLIGTHLPHKTCSAFAGNALNWVPLIGLDTLLPFIDAILPIAQTVEDQYNTYFKSAQDAAKQRQQISTLISSNDALITKLKDEIISNEGDVISIQTDLFTLNTNRNAAKDTLQVESMLIASLSCKSLLTSLAKMK